MKEDCRAILRTPVRSLPVQLSWFVVSPENLRQSLVRNSCLVILNFDCLRMASLIGRDVFIGWILQLPSCISNPRRGHAGQLTEGSLNAPKTAGRKSSFCHGVLRFEIQVLDA